jgi:hypothetical protein
VTNSDRQMHDLFYATPKLRSRRIVHWVRLSFGLICTIIGFGCVWVSWVAAHLQLPVPGSEPIPPFQPDYFLVVIGVIISAPFLLIALLLLIGSVETSA